MSAAPGGACSSSVCPGIFGSGIEEKGASSKDWARRRRSGRPPEPSGAPESASPALRKPGRNLEGTKGARNLETGDGSIGTARDGSGARWKVRRNPGTFGASFEGSTRRFKGLKRVPDFCAPSLTFGETPEGSAARGKARELAGIFGEAPQASGSPPSAPWRDLIFCKSMAFRVIEVPNPGLGRILRYVHWNPRYHPVSSRSGEGSPCERFGICRRGVDIEKSVMHNLPDLILTSRSA